MVRSRGSVARAGISVAAEELSCSTELVRLGIGSTGVSDVPGPAAVTKRCARCFRKADTAGQNTVLTLFTLKDGDLNFASGATSRRSRTKATMLSQCANSNCCRPVTSLSEGRLYQFEIVSISISANDDNAVNPDETPQRETAHFWLCASCAKTMTLELEPLTGLRLLPLEHMACDPPVRRPTSEIHDC